MAWRDATSDILTPLTLRAVVTFINLLGQLQAYAYAYINRVIYRTRVAIKLTQFNP